MTHSLSSARPFAAFVALAWTTLTIGSAIAPAPAQAAEGPYYRAELAAPAKAAKPIAGGMVWSCSQNACTSGKGTSRPAIVCARLVKEVGPVASFTAAGKALEADDIARCNAN